MFNEIVKGQIGCFCGVISKLNVPRAAVQSALHFQYRQGVCLNNAVLLVIGWKQLAELFKGCHIFLSLTVFGQGRKDDEVFGLNVVDVRPQPVLVLAVAPTNVQLLIGELVA